MYYNLLPYLYHFVRCVDQGTSENATTLPLAIVVGSKSLRSDPGVLFSSSTCETVVDEHVRLQIR